MSEEQTIKEKLNQMEMAMESVLNEEQAKDVINNKFNKDAYLLKLKVNVENKAGAMLILISVLKCEVLMVYSVFGNSTIIRKIGTFEDPNQFSGDMLAAMESGAGMDKSFSDNIGRIFYTKYDAETIERLRPEIEKKDFNNFDKILEEGINATYKVKSASVEADMEKINSVRFRLSSNLVEKVPPVTKPEVTQETEEEAKPEKSILPEVEKSEIDREIDELVSQYPATVTSKTVLSPVSGVEFEKLQPNQKILMQLPFQTPEQKTIARKLGAEVKDGRVKPIVAEFIKVIPGHKNEYHIFARGPKGILLKAFEERPVRLAVPKNSPRIQADEESFLSRYAFLIFIIGFLIVGSIVYIFLNS